MSEHPHDRRDRHDRDDDAPRPWDEPVPASFGPQGIAADATREETPWRRLDRRMLFIQPVQTVVQFLPLIVVWLFVGPGRGDGPWWTNLFIVIVPIVVGIWAWFTTTYRITHEQLTLRRGIIQRRRITARLDRIRTVDVTATLLHRMLGVATVKVGTGGDSPFSLDGLAAEDARDLREQLLHQARDPRGEASAVDGADTEDASPVADGREEELARFSPAWIRYAPFSLAGLVTILAIGAFGLQFVDRLSVAALESDAGEAVVDYATSLTLTMMVVQGAVVAVVALLLAAIATYVLRYWGYLLTRHPRGTLAVSRGLLTTRNTTIEEARLRGVTVQRPFLLRLVGGARANALVTGLSGEAGSNSSSSSDLLVPPAPHATVRDITAVVLRDDTALATPLRQHGPAARRRRHIRALLFALWFGVPLSVLTWWWDWSGWFHGVLAVLLLTAPLIAEGRYARLGHAVTGRHLVSRSGLFPEETTVAITSAVIGWNVAESYFQRRLGLVTLSATVAAGDDSVVFLDIPLADAEAVIRAVTPGLPEPFMEPRGEGGDGTPSRLGSSLASASPV